MIYRTTGDRRMAVYAVEAWLALVPLPSLHACAGTYERIRSWWRVTVATGAWGMERLTQSTWLTAAIAVGHCTLVDALVEGGR